MLTNAEVLNTIAGSEIGRRILRDAAAERLEARRALVAERDHIIADGQRRGATAAQTYYEAKAAREKAEAALAAAWTRETEAAYAWSTTSSSIERGAARCNRELEATADARINELLSWLQSAHNRACEVSSPALPPEPSLASRMLGKVASRSPSRRGPSYPEIIRTAIAQARELKYQALDAEELNRRIEEILASVPSEYAIEGRP